MRIYNQTCALEFQREDLEKLLQGLLSNLELDFFIGWCVGLASHSEEIDQIKYHYSLFSSLKRV